MSLSSVAIAASAKAGKQSEHNADIIEFVEAPWGLKMTLFPVQKVILKAHYGLELDDTERFTITDWRRQNARHVTEKEYLKILFEEGRCNIGEVIPGKQRREMILSIGRRSGKCVRGDTLIPTDMGIVPISSLGDITDNGMEYQPLSVRVAQEMGDVRRTAFFYKGGVKPTKAVMTESGYFIEGTDNHRIKVLTPDCEVVWKYLGDVKAGDLACINRSSNLWAKEYVDLRPYQSSPFVGMPDFLTEEWGELLGIVSGDGNWTNKRALRVTTADPEFKDIFLDKAKAIFGKASYVVDKRGTDVGDVYVYGKVVRSFMDKIGWSIKATPYDKRVPFTIMRSPKSVVAAYLRGLFETDGSATGNSVCFSTSSKQLAYDVQALLLNFGIVTNTSVSRETEWVVRVKGTASKLKFKNEIGFLTQRKKSMMDKQFENLSYRSPHPIDAVPYLLPFLKQHLSLRKIFCNGNKKVSQLELGRILEEKDTPSYVRAKINSLLDLDYFFDPVQSVTEGECEVYDLNVPEGSMFIGNGFTNHNTTISACIAAYETYKLIKKGDPQKYYGLPASNNIQIISVATDKDQAGLLYQEVSGHYRNCSFFGPYTANNTLSYARFQTPADVDKYGRYLDDPSAKATLKVTFRSCVAKGLRGAGNICVILDEVAHFTDKGQSGAEEVYNAVVPSTSAYSPKDPINPTKPIGEVEGRVILISSPLGKQGLFYNLFQIGMQGGAASDNILAVQAPTWEVNPTVPASEFEKHYLKNPTVFFTEYGGEFTDRTRGWLEKEEDLYECVDPKLRPVTSAPARKPHYMGIDLGLVGDASAIAIGHLEGDKIILDLVDQIKAGEGKFKDKERLDFDEVADWIHGWSKRFYISDAIFDQWVGIPLQQALEKRGLKQMVSVNMTKQLTSQMFQNFKDMMWDKRLRLYDKPDPDINGHEPYLLELLELQATVHSKNIISVEAPQVAGKHDDMSDALVRMIWVASNHIGTQKHFALSGGSSRHPLMAGSKVLAQGSYFKGGSDERRIAPRPARPTLRDAINKRFGGSS